MSPKLTWTVNWFMMGTSAFQTTLLSMSPGAMDDLMYILIALLATAVLFILALIFVSLRLKSKQKKYNPAVYTILTLLIITAGYLASTQTQNEEPHLFIISSTLVFFSILLIVIVRLQDRNGLQ